jgi:excisionase family DNA binding protein
MTQPTATAQDLFTVREGAKYLHICERTMRELIAYDEITYRRTGGKKKGRIVFTKDDLDARLQPAGGPGAKKQTRRGY